MILAGFIKTVMYIELSNDKISWSFLNLKIQVLLPSSYDFGV